MTVTVYRSTDASAPVLTNAVGSLVALLDACLVNGYGAKAGAGWTKPFSSGSTVAAYKQGTGSNNMYCRIDDTVVSTARIVGYENMTSISSGTGSFPLDAQFSGGLYVSKSTAATTTPWTIVATSKQFYLIINVTNAVSEQPSWQHATFFGDISSFKGGDAYGTAIIAQHAASYTTAYMSSIINSVVVGNTASSSGHYLARPYHQLSTSTPFGKFYNHLRGTSLPFPSTITGEMMLSPFTIAENCGAVRGTLPGMWAVHHSYSSIPDGYVFTFSAGPLIGKTVEFRTIATSMVIAFEISDTWS